MVYSQLHDGVTCKRTNQSCDKKVMTDLTKLVQKCHNSEKINIISIQVVFMGYQWYIKSDKIAGAFNKEHSGCI